MLVEVITRFWVVKAIPGHKIVNVPGQKPIVGYHQRFGVTAETEESMRQLVADYMMRDMASTIASIEDQGEPDFDDEDAEIRPLVKDTHLPGIWFVSGRAFYQKADLKKVN